MKNKMIALGLVALMSCLDFSSGASAQTADSGSVAKANALTWLQSQLTAGESFKSVIGRSAGGKLCGLYLTDLLSHGGEEIFYVVVGYENTSDDNDYIGIGFKKSTVEQTNSAFTFTADESWGNDSQRNRVKIVMDRDGKPVRALGVSDLREIDCRLD